jgi:hypothetical protein
MTFSKQLVLLKKFQTLLLPLLITLFQLPMVTLLLLLVNLLKHLVLSPSSLLLLLGVDHAVKVVLVLLLHLQTVKNNVVTWLMETNLRCSLLLVKTVSLILTMTQSLVMIKIKLKSSSISTLLWICQLI